MTLPSTSTRALFLLLAASLPVAACGDDDAPPNTGTDAGVDAAAVDAGPPEEIEDLPIDEQLNLPGLDAPVDVVRDSRGVPHIYGTTLHDVVMVQGFLMAKDRIGQMELIRRNVEGRLADYAGSLDRTLIDGDIEARFFGHRRNAERIYASLGATSPEKQALDAFAEGVNVYIARVRAEEEILPPAVAESIAPSILTDWEPENSLAIGRYLSWYLSYTAADEVAYSEFREAVNDVFPEGSATPAIAKRAGFFDDYLGFYPAENVFSRDGFPNTPTDMGTTAIRNPRRPREDKRRPSRELLERANRFFARVAERQRFFGGHDRGSNNWLVAGSKSQSGHPLLANDPHLGLTSPALFWFSHLNTKRAGGTLNVQGLSLAGVPGVILGYNDHVAWGSTTANYDVTDVYEETITPGVGGAPDTVLFNGTQVAIQKRMEHIDVDNGADVEVELEFVPHHGFFVPEISNGRVVPRTGNRALAVRWTGDDISNDIGAFLRLNLATNLTEAKAALDLFEVGGQSFVLATAAGEIMWSGQARIPTRPAAALTYDSATEAGQSPCFVLPGTGEYEWTGNLGERYIPHALNPAAGFVATANNDLVGVNADGNPLNDPYYLGCVFDIGHRIARITERLEEVTADNMASVEDMQSIQGDDRSPMGAKLTAPIVASLGKLLAESATPGTHPELAAVVTAIGTTNMPKIEAMRTRLMGWTSFRTPAAVEGAPTAAEIDDSIATSIFNAILPRLAHLTLDDELERIDNGSPYPGGPVFIQRALLAPSTLRTYDASITDTVVWDDLTTESVVETRDERVARAALAALTFLETTLGSDVTMWRWGRLHRIRFDSLLQTLSRDRISIPEIGDAMFPDGYPRHGDNYGVDASNSGFFSQTSHNYGSGPVQRLVVEMTPTGPRAFNALPGGQSNDPDSPHHHDEAQHWRRNQAPEMNFQEIQVVMNAEHRIRVAP